MLKERVIPSSLDGIKKLAKSIKSEQNIKHTQALNAASVIAGYQNFNHARNILNLILGNKNKLYCVYLTAYWHDKESSIKGRETLTIWLETNWNDLVTPYQMQINRGLRDFRIEGPDHLAYRYTLDGQSRARERVCAAVSNLQFMDATKLRPSTSYRAYPKNSPKNSVPLQDHASIWVDVKTKRYLIADEPYNTSLDNMKRIEWSKNFGQRIALSTWKGMYNPGNSDLFLISDIQNGVPLDPLLLKLNKLPNPITEENWNGESVPYLPFFVSPGSIEREAQRKVKIAKEKKTNNNRGNTTRYIMTFVGPHLRPKAKLPIETHQALGQLLKNIMSSTSNRKGVYNRIDSVRSELDEWVQREYSRSELPDEQFFDLYYHEEQSKFSGKLSIVVIEAFIKDLDKVKQVLSSQYPDCGPVRKMLKKVDLAITSLKSWY